MLQELSLSVPMKRSSISSVENVLKRNNIKDKVNLKVRSTTPIAAMYLIMVMVLNV